MALMRKSLVSDEAQLRYQADVELAGERSSLLAAAQEAEAAFRAAQGSRVPVGELHKLAVGLDAALSATVRAAFAAQRAESGPRGYADRIYRRKMMATPAVHALTAEAERLLTLRETHRLNNIPDVPLTPAV
jgi:hypothetical protein